MIIRKGADRIEFITQPDHARLARRVMERCEPLRAHPRRESVLLAVGEHDNGWTDEDATPGVDPRTGEALDFIHAPVAVRQRVWPRGVSRLSSDPWAAALVAQHALVAYDRYREDPEWKAFFELMTRRRDELVGRSPAPLGELLDDYAFVRVGDLISLTFCLDATGEQRYREYVVSASEPRVVRLSPEIFGGQVVSLEITGRAVPSQRFSSAESLKDTLEGAEPFTIRGTLSPA